MNFAYRQDFGFGNPNVAGALFAVLIFAVFFLPAEKRWARAVQFLGAALFFAALLLTASRGALIALAVGSFTAWIIAGRPKPRWSLLLLGCVAAMILVAVFGGRLSQRMQTLSPDEGSTASRITIYQSIPAMIVAAPGGWGLGNAAHAFENWFQPIEETTSFKNLLSTHGTWMVERGWLFSVFYLLVWSLALLLAWARPAAFGLLVTWGTCAAWSHLGGAWWMWTAPLLAVGVSLHARYRRKIWPTRSTYACVLLLPILFLLTSLVVMTWRAGRDRIFNDGSVVWVGGKSPTLWFLQPDFSVMGRTYGKKLRSIGNLAIANRWEQIPDGAALVLSGSVATPTKLPRLSKIIWLNPPALLLEEFSQLIHQTPATHIIWGELRSDADPTQLRNSVQSLPNVCWRTAGGKAKYLGDADWMQLFSENN